MHLFLRYSLEPGVLSLKHITFFSSVSAGCIGAEEPVWDIEVKTVLLLGLKKDTGTWDNFMTALSALFSMEYIRALINDAGFLFGR